MISEHDAFVLMEDVSRIYADITILDAFDMVGDIYELENPEGAHELRKLVFQYAQRLVNS